MANDGFMAIKVLVVGGKVGKTSMLITLTSNIFPVEYLPSVFDCYSPGASRSNYEVDGRPILLSYWDTISIVHEYERLHKLSFPGSDVVLFCFSVDDRNSLEAIMNIWYGHVRVYCPSCPIILVGTKSDLRRAHLGSSIDPTVSTCIPYVECIDMAKKIGASAYIECSALQKHNIKLVFDLAARTVIHKNTQTIAKMGKETEKEKEKKTIFSHLRSYFGFSQKGQVVAQIPSHKSAPSMQNDHLHFISLPPPVLQMVFSFLSPPELALCERVSVQFREWAKDDSVWEIQCQQIDPLIKISQFKDPMKKIFQSLTSYWKNDFSVPPLPAPPVLTST